MKFCPKFDITTDIDSANFAEFRSDSKISSVVSDEQIIDNLNLFTDERTFKTGAVLFFGNNPENYVDSAFIRCVRYDGKTKKNINDDKYMKGPLYSQYQKCIDWLKGKLDVGYKIEGTGPSKEKWEIPRTVFKETIINALSHRDYYEKGACIMIEVFDDRVEISNPGGLLPAISSSQFGKRSLSRNPLIFGLFNQMGMVEKVGSGVPRVRELMKERVLPEPVFETEGMFTVALYRPERWEEKLKKYEKLFTANQLTIIHNMKKNPEITIPELSAIVGISTTAIENNIRKLKESNIIRREGSDKDGLWIVL